MSFGDTTRRNALVANLCTRICDDRRSLDELLVLDKLFERIELGADRYGPLDLAKTRDWERELAEELLDVQVYRAIKRVLDHERATQPLIEFEMPDGDAR